MSIQFVVLSLDGRRAATSVDGRLNRCGFPGRIAFKVALGVDSRMIIDENGAEHLNGKGDLLLRDSTGLRRGECIYIFDEDLEKSCVPVATDSQF